MFNKKQTLIMYRYCMSQESQRAVTNMDIDKQRLIKGNTKNKRVRLGR